MWARCYRRAEVTLANVDPSLVELKPSLARLAPPAKGFSITRSIRLGRKAGSTRWIL